MFQAVIPERGTLREGFVSKPHHGHFCLPSRIIYPDFFLRQVPPKNAGKSKRKNRPAEARAVFCSRLSRGNYFAACLSSFFSSLPSLSSVARPRPAYLLLNFARRPFSSTRAEPPVHAGWFSGSMSRRMTSPGLPQRVRVFGAVGHDDFDFVVIGMDIGLHGGSSLKSLSGWLFTEIFLIVQAIY